MRARFVFGTLSAAVALLVPSVTFGQARDVAAQESTAVPVNVGLVPYVDVNSHFDRPRNNVSLDGLVGFSYRIDGVAIAGLSGFVWEGARGVQLAGLSGWVGGDFTGAQIGGLVSATGGEVTGLQAAGVVSYADGVSGAQLGVVNVAPGAVTGAQIGLVNVGGAVQGAQVGLVNVADEVDGATVGLVNVVRKNGRLQLEASTSNTAALSVATKLGSKHVYSILGMGLQPAKGKVAWMPTVGIGGSIPVRERVFVNIEALASAVNIGSEFDEETILGQLRVAAGYQVSDEAALFAGPVVDVFRSSSDKRLEDISYTPTLKTFDEHGTPVDLGLGFVVGLQAF